MEKKKTRLTSERKLEIIQELRQEVICKQQIRDYPFLCNMLCYIDFENDKIYGDKIQNGGQFLLWMKKFAPRQQNISDSWFDSEDYKSRLDFLDMLEKKVKRNTKKNLQI